MRFLPDARELALREEFRTFFEQHCPPDYAEHCDTNAEFPIQLFGSAGECGMFGLTVPAEYGGRGEDAVALAILFEEAGRAFPDFANLVVRQALCSSAILRSGPEAVRQQYLPRFAAGTVHMAFAATEPDAGSDVASMRTTIEPVDGELRIDGNKVFATGSDVGDAMLVLGRLPETTRRHGLSAVVVATDSHGVGIERMATLGVRATGSARVRLDGVRVGTDQMVGELGDGWSVLTGGLDLERLATSAIACGAANFLIEHVADYLRGRHQFGGPLSRLQMVRHRMADLAMDVDSAELAMFRTAYRISNGIGTHVEASVAKLAATEAYMRTAHAAVQLEGGYGYSGDAIVQRHFRDAKMYEIGGGASDVQREIIARGLGL